MAVPFVTQQMIRIVTEKVLENIASRQQQRSLPPSVETTSTEGTKVVGVDPTAFNQLVRYVGQLEAELNAVKERHAALEGKITRLEKRWSWRTMFRVVVAVVVSFLLGALLVYGAHLGGWY